MIQLLNPLLKDLWTACGGNVPPPPASDAAGTAAQRLLFPVLVQVLKLLRDFCAGHVQSMPLAGCNKLFAVVAGVFSGVAARVRPRFVEAECATLFPIVLAILQHVAAKTMLDFSSDSLSLIHI